MAKKVSEKLMDNSFGVAGVVLGILSIVFLSVNGAIMGIIGLIFSMKQNKRYKNKWSKAGMWLNIIGIVIGIVATIFVASYVATYGLGAY